MDQNQQNATNQEASQQNGITGTAKDSGNNGQQAQAANDNTNQATSESIDFAKIISDDAKKSEILKHLGVPEKAEEYAFDDKAFASDAKISEIVKEHKSVLDGEKQRLDIVRKFAHENKLTKDQAGGLKAMLDNHAKEYVINEYEAMKGGYDHLKQTFGKDYQKKVEYAESLMNNESISPLFAKFISSNPTIKQSSIYPVLLGLFADIGKQYSNDTTQTTSGNGNSVDLEKRLKEIQSSDEFQNERHPKHREAVREREGLVKRLFEQQQGR